MPLKKAFLSKWCDAPAVLCMIVGNDCKECTYIGREKAEAAMIKEKLLSDKASQPSDEESQPR